MLLVNLNLTKPRIHSSHERQLTQVIGLCLEESLRLLANFLFLGCFSFVLLSPLCLKKSEMEQSTRWRPQAAWDDHESPAEARNAPVSVAGSFWI